jgi:hypothetical protein
VDGRIEYLNSDLDLKSAIDLTALTTALEAGGANVLHVSKGDHGLWYATIEDSEAETEVPERNIAALLSIIESLDEALISIWSSCSLREFNIGYDCGDEPWSFNQGLSNELLGRIVSAGASLRWTLYPDRPTGNGTANENSPNK